MKLSHSDYYKIAIPFIVSTITQPLLGAVDTAVIGQMQQAALIGGVAIGTVILNTLYWLFGFFRVSTTGQSAMALGKGCERDLAASLVRPFVLASGVGFVFIFAQAGIWQAALWMIEPDADVAVQAQSYFSILIWGAPFVLLNYTLIGWLMGQAKVKATLFTQIFGNVLNIVLDIVFVVGFDMGVEGVALASLIAQVSTFAIGLYLVKQTAGFSFMPYLKLAKMSKQQLATIASSNSDLMLRTVCLLLMFNCMARFGSSMGADVLAANAIMMQITFLASYLFDGIANASSVFAGRSVGEKNPSLLEQVLTMNMQWTAGAVVLLTLVIGLTHDQLALIFTQIPQVLNEYQQVSLWLVIFPLVAGFGLTVYGIFTGTGTTRPVRNSTAMTVAIFLIACWLTLDSFGNQGLWFAFTLFYVGRIAFLYPYLSQVKAKTLA
ncbi:MATE family efflux transporter [Vibrio sp. SCSIO 43136]|uniref:MATE family efflux transporter n=1 Tax=Vibrio sp. SCSIO 43136 TaxID=2819101 RepID=UPI0020763664|nr:MATE family efflux transporter [Vibrio sp. SCSIO 43136]USD66124.1 MATE family efflux transporter [Vibrio sp. SCSIO 43136]